MRPVNEHDVNYTHQKLHYIRHSFCPRIFGFFIENYVSVSKEAQIPGVTYEEKNI